MNAPPLFQFTAERQREVVAALREIMPGHAVLFDEEDTRPYECDALTAFRQLPMVVVLPENEMQVAAFTRDQKLTNAAISFRSRTVYTI